MGRSTGQGSLQADGSLTVREGCTSLILSESWLLFSLDLLMPLRSQYSGGGAVTVSLSAGVAKASLTCSRFSVQEKSQPGREGSLGTPGRGDVGQVNLFLLSLLR